MRARIHGALIGLVCLLGALILLLAIEHVRGKSAISSFRKQLTAAGETLSVADLTPPRPNLDDNAALLILNAQRRLPQQPNLQALALPPLRQWIAPGQATVGWQLDEWKTGDMPGNWAELLPLLEDAEPALFEIRAALKRPGWDPGIIYFDGFDSMPSHFVELRQVETWLALATAAELHLGRNEIAIEHLRALVALIARMGSEHLLISQLVRVSMVWKADAATWELLHAPGWSDNQLAALQREWESIDFLRDMISSLEMERAMTVDHFAKLRSQQAHRDTLIQQSPIFDSRTYDFSDIPGIEPSALFLRSTLWAIAWSRQDELRALRRWQDSIDRARAMAEAARLDGTFEPMEDGFPLVLQLLAGAPDQESGWFDRLRFPMSVQSPNIGPIMLQRAVQTEILRRLTVTAIALHRYQLAAGSFPPDLEALVPQFLAEVPIDLMTGLPLRYRLRVDDSFLLYSVGENGIDNGGDPSPRPPRTNPRDPWAGHDVVWPQAVTAAEKQP